jgi:hypothetical protein
MKKQVIPVVLAIVLAGCSTSGGMYREGDPVNGNFSVWRTIALPFAVAGVAAGAAIAGAAAATPEPAVSCTYTRYGNTVYQRCY